MLDQEIVQGRFSIRVLQRSVLASVAIERSIVVRKTPHVGLITLVVIGRDVNLWMQAVCIAPPAVRISRAVSVGLKETRLGILISDRS